MTTISRRTFAQAAGGLALTACGSGNPEAQAVSPPAPTSPTSPTSTAWRMPDEAAPHARTWMAFGASEAIWGRRLLPEVQRNVATIARTIAQFEPVTLLVRSSELATAKTLLAGSAVQLLESPLDDLWMRDTGPCFVVNPQGDKAGIGFNFNGWGQKQAYAQDRQVASTITQSATAMRLSTRLVLEGGCIEVDGQGTAIITESCTLNSNRNPGLSKADFEALLKPLLGLQKIIWLPGIQGKDITDGHTDFYARFASPGVVLAGYDPDPASYDHAVTRQHLALLAAATDAQGRKLKVMPLEAPSTLRIANPPAEFAAGYIGFYACNGAIIAQEFGDAQADKAAKLALESAFPGSTVVQLNVDGIASGGGSIHCTTQQEPKAG